MAAAGLTITGQPAAIAGATWWMIRFSGCDRLEIPVCPPVVDYGAELQAQAAAIDGAGQ